MQKLKVLIADDEYQIGMLIKMLINWEKYQLECVDVVKNGADAFEKIINNEPDIVITDIKMPRISGLDLIAKVKEKGLKCRFIVVSGFKDFEYARSAMKYGVTSYLLKPISKVELNEAIAKICAEKKLENQKQIESQNMTQAVNSSRELVNKSIFRDIIDQRLAEEFYDKEKYGMKFKGNSYRILDMKLDYVHICSNDSKQDSITTEKIIHILRKIFQKEDYDTVLCDMPNMHLYCLVAYDSLVSAKTKELICQLLTNIQHFLIGFDQYQITIGISEEAKNIDKIFDRVMQAKISVENRIKFGTNRLIYASCDVKVDNKRVSEIFEKKQEMFSMAIDNYCSEKLTLCIQELFDQLLICEDHESFYCYQLAEMIIHAFFKHNKIQKDGNERIQLKMLSLYQHCYTVQGLKEYLIQNLCSCMELNLNVLEMKAKKPIRLAQQYIYQHYNEKINLEDIAEIVELNAAYFSVLFKKETGVNISNYIINVRMETAKKFLIETNNTIIAIADEVGYKDVRYFSRLFAKTVGVNPAIYRKLYA